MTDKAFALLLYTLLFTITACDQSSKDGDNVLLAEVGNQRLMLNDVKNDVSAERYAEDSLQVIDHYRNNWIKRQLKVEEVRRLGLDQQAEVQRRIQRAEESILVDAFNEAVYLEVTGEPVSRSEAQAYYESNKEKFVLAERHVRFRHLRATSLSDAENARNAIQRGRSWRDVAAQYSVNPEQTLRHSQQYWPLSEAASEYESLNSFLQAIGVSEISPIRRIGDYYHFVQLMETRDAGEHPEVDWIIDQLTEWLMLERKRKHLRSLEQNLFLQAQANNELRIFDVKEPEEEIEIITDSL